MVVDTNVFISAIVGHGKPRRLVLKLIERHEIVVSPQMLAELADVLSRDKFSEVDEHQVKSLLSAIARNASMVTIKRPTKAVPEDPDDDMVLNTAYEAKASVVVSGDSHLLRLAKFRGIRILTVSELLRLL